MSFFTDRAASNERGFLSPLSIVILAFIALAGVKFFLNWDIFDAAESDQGQSTILYMRDLVNFVWSYIGAPLTFIWERIVGPLLALAWDNLQTFIEKGRALDLPPVSLPS